MVINQVIKTVSNDIPEEILKKVLDYHESGIAMYALYYSQSVKYIEEQTIKALKELIEYRKREANEKS